MASRGFSDLAPEEGSRQMGNGYPVVRSLTLGASGTGQRVRGVLIGRVSSSLTCSCLCPPPTEFSFMYTESACSYLASPMPHEFLSFSLSLSSCSPWTQVPVLKLTAPTGLFSSSIFQSIVIGLTYRYP